MDKEFIIKMYHYIDGELKLFVEEFDKIEDAIEHGLSKVCHSFKIFDRDGRCHHDQRGNPGETYC